MADEPLFNVLYGISVGGGNDLIKIDGSENKQCLSNSAPYFYPKCEKSKKGRKRENSLLKMSTDMIILSNFVL